MNTTEKGNLTELKIAVRLLESGKTVLRSIGEGCRYDLVIDEKGKFTRVQCKTGRLRNGVIVFNCVSQYAWKKEYRSYNGSADLFGVYCPETAKCYLVPVELLTRKGGCLRVAPVKNNQTKKVRFAKDFEI